MQIRPTTRSSTRNSSLLAVQGPRALETLQKLTSTQLAPILYYHFEDGEVAGVPARISRTGYRTGYAHEKTHWLRGAVVAVAKGLAPGWAGSDSAEKLKSNKQLLKQPERVHNNLATKRSLQRKTPMN